VSKARSRRLLAVVALALSLSGCAANTGPKKYNDDIKANYTKACTAANTEKLSVADAATYCECTYNGLSQGDSAVPFSDFKAFDNDVRAKAGSDLKTKADLAAKYPKIVEIFDKCVAAGPAAPASTGDSSSTTTTTTTSR
jgi:hypothetical protein